MRMIFTKRLICLIMIVNFLFFLLFVQPIEATQIDENEKIVVVSGDEEDQKDLKQPFVTPDGPRSQQKYVIPVVGTSNPKPGVYWYQHDNGEWVADIQGRDPIKVSNRGTDEDPMPSLGTVPDRINMNDQVYKPEKYSDANIKEYYPREVTNAHIANARTTDTQGKTSLITSLKISNKTYIEMTSITGEASYPNSDKYTEGYNRPQVVNGVSQKRLHTNFPKNTAFYATPLEIEWRATIVENKKIQVKGKTKLAVGEDSNYTANIATMASGQTSYAGWVDVSTRTEQTTWKSKNEAVATVDAVGKVHAVSPGTAEIVATWKSGLYWLEASINVTVGVEGCTPGDPDCDIPDIPPGGVSCTDPQPDPSQSLTGKVMDPAVTAVIKADRRGAEQFNVLQGIPTSESLYGNVKSKEYLFQNKFTPNKGVCTYTINVKKTYTLKWDPGKTVPNTNGTGTHTEPDPQTETQDKTYTYEIKRNYAFWKIENLEVYDINHATLENYAWDEVSISPAGYDPPTYETSLDGFYYPADDPGDQTAPAQTISGEKTKPAIPNDQGSLQSVADKAVGKVEVENDSLQFNNQTIIDNQRTKETGPRPVAIPLPNLIGDDVLYSPDHMISNTKINKADQPSTGTIYYDLMSGNVNGGEDKQFAILGINTVTVHTPVVNYSSISDDQAHNQKTQPNMQRSALILERPFIVTIPTSGQHTNYLGYGNRDYAKYFRIKQVKFPFDVYTGDRTTFIPKNTWIDVPVGQLTTTFYLPVWVDEGDYQVAFRNIAENAPSPYTEQNDANTNLIHHAAADEVSVEVIGRVYDFHITDIADYNWERVFRTQAGTALQTGVSYWVGQNTIDGDPRGNPATYTVPIRPGSNPLQGYKNVAVKTGYHFKFDFRTKGNMFGPLDGIRITPRFYYVRKDGKAINSNGDTRLPVDLYYQTNQNQFVKIGSKQDQVQRYVILNDRLRNVPIEELNDTASYKFNHYGQAGSLSKSQFISYYVNKFTKQKTPVGTYNLLLLPEQVRTFLRLKENIPSSVNQERANVSIQKWYGEYSLPAAPYVVAAGTNVAEYGRTHGGLDDKSAIFLKNGYIVVNFNIESIQEGNLKKPHLQYIYAPLMNQWNMEGFSRSIQDSSGNRFSLKDGDVMFYSTDQSSRNDFSAQVPH